MSAAGDGEAGTVFRSIGVIRLRMATDGEGVTTLVGGHGCPLACRYCLNPQCGREDGLLETLDAETLYARVKRDDLYYLATGGGVTFGGGEPLLQSAFLSDFIRMCRERGHTEWKFSLETSLAVPNGALARLDGLIDRYIVDCKDMTPEIYRAYTGKTPEYLFENLAYLAARCPEKVTVRVPLIPGFNTDADRDASAARLREMGFSNLDLFDYRMPEKK